MSYHLKKPENFADSPKLIIFAVPLKKGTYTLNHTHTQSQTSIRGVAQLASALAWGARGRKFESSHPDKKGFNPKQKLVNLMIYGLFCFSDTKSKQLFSTKM